MILLENREEAQTRKLEYSNVFGTHLNIERYGDKQNNGDDD